MPGRNWLKNTPAVLSLIPLQWQHSEVPIRLMVKTISSLQHHSAVNRFLRKNVQNFQMVHLLWKRYKFLFGYQIRPVMWIMSMFEKLILHFCGIVWSDIFLFADKRWWWIRTTFAQGDNGVFCFDFLLRSFLISFSKPCCLMFFAAFCLLASSMRLSSLVIFFSGYLLGSPTHSVGLMLFRITWKGTTIKTRTRPDSLVVSCLRVREAVASFGASSLHSFLPWSATPIQLL